MKRTPEPELMDEASQARAYAEADFSEPHNHFIELMRERFPDLQARNILDLGCGPGDISRRLAHAYPLCKVTGVDGSPAMLEVGCAQTRQAGLEQRVELILGYLPEASLPEISFCAVVSNSLLHHLADPEGLWKTIRSKAKAGTAIFVMDLMRPEGAETARAMVERYAGGESDLLKRDFENSLHAAYRPQEVQSQLAAHRLEALTVEAVSDRHLIVYGTI